MEQRKAFTYRCRNSLHFRTRLFLQCYSISMTYSHASWFENCAYEMEKSTLWPRTVYEKIISYTDNVVHCVTVRQCRQR